MSRKPVDGHEKARVPPPAHAHERREPLPWRRSKAREEDPDALRRIEAIQSSPSYRESDKDLDFLAEYETRGLRLQLDYLKPELLLERRKSGTEFWSGTKRAASRC